MGQEWTTALNYGPVKAPDVGSSTRHTEYEVPDWRSDTRITVQEDEEHSAMRTFYWSRIRACPHGAIRWPDVTDKEGKEWVAPITQRVRAGLDRLFRERPGIGAAYVFPCPTDPSRPVQYERVRTWLRQAETLAKLPKQRGSSFHAYRRAWATARKHLPVTVAAAGGWKSTATIQRCYQQPDEGTMLSVVLGGAELREKKA